MLEELLKYQELDAELYEHEQSVVKSEVRQKTAVAKKFLDSVKEKLDMIEENAKRLNDTYDNYKKTYAELTAEKEDFEKAINDVADGDEVAYLQKKATDLMNKIGVVEKQTNTLKKHIAELMEAYDKLRRQTSNAKKQYEEYAPKYKELKESKKSEMDGIAAKLSAMEAGIAKDIMEKYKIRRKSGFPVLYPMRDDGMLACPKCGMSFSMADKNKIAQNGVMECESCHVLIYDK